MTPESLHFTLDSTLETIERIEHLAIEHAQRMGFAGPSLDQIILAVHETAANAVFHGNDGLAHKKVFVDIDLNENQFKITIGDQGKGFDPEKVPDPLGAEEIFRERGRGVFLSKALMDEYQVQCPVSGGSIVTLVKYLNHPDGKGHS